MLSGPPSPDFQIWAADWQNNPTVALAGDIVSAALVWNDTEPPLVDEAAKFVITKSAKAPNTLVAAARRILEPGTQTAGDTKPLHGVARLLHSERQHQLHRRIRHLKSAIVEFGHNPIAFADLARLYLLLGHRKKAEKCMSVAISLAPLSRFVLRSAARLHVHCGDPERGFDLLYRSPRTRHDPWLASAALATAGIVGKEKLAIRLAMRLLKNSDLSPLSLTELRAGVGSLELSHGDRRRSKRLFRAALAHANDNSLAQIEWALSQDPLFDVDLSVYEVARRYEALAIDAYNQQQWDDLLVHCASWLTDLPYLSRPALVAAHVASVVLDDYAAAQTFCEASRMVSPEDPQLANMHAYALALDNQADAALEILDATPVSRVQNLATRACLRATRGLAYFRAGRILEGRAMYLAAIKEAEGIREPTWRQIAVLNYAREEFTANRCVPEALFYRVRSLKIPRRAVTTQIFKDKVVALLTAAR